MSSGMPDGTAAASPGGATDNPPCPKSMSEAERERRINATELQALRSRVKQLKVQKSELEGQISTLRMSFAVTLSRHIARCLYR